MTYDQHYLNMRFPKVHPNRRGSSYSITIWSNTKRSNIPVDVCSLVLPKRPFWECMTWAGFFSGSKTIPPEKEVTGELGVIQCVRVTFGPTNSDGWICLSITPHPLTKLTLPQPLKNHVHPPFPLFFGSMETSEFDTPKSHVMKI